MANKEGSRRNYLTLKAIDAGDGKKCEILISHERILAVGRRSMAHAKECGVIVPQVLQKPAAVFEGLRQDEDEDRHGYGWRCYCGVPRCAYHSDGSERAAFPGKVYLVFVNDERVAYNWRWELADPNDHTLPQNHAQRFKTRLI